MNEHATVELSGGPVPSVDLPPLDSLDTGRLIRQTKGVESIAGTALIEPEETLRIEEAEQSRAVARVTILVTLPMFFVTPFVGGDLVLVEYASLAVALVACGILWVRSLDPENFGGRWVMLAWLLGTISACGNATYLGVHSGALAITMLPIYFGTLGRNRTTGWLCYGVAAVYMAGISISHWTGVLPDVGQLHVRSDKVLVAIGLHVMNQAILLATVFFARSIRRARETVIAKLHRAAIAALKRNAAAAEAQAELARVRLRGLGQLTGTTVGGFTLEDQIGRGGMAEVYSAAHANTGVRAAVKVLLPSIESDDQMVRRFLREVEVVERLHSPHIVEILGSGTHDGRPYLAMELLEGDDLATKLRGGKALRMSEVLRMATDVGRGIDAAAAADVVHRDIKPQNIFAVSNSGRRTVWKILDFGISRLSESGNTMTQDHILGTPQYMAPEQAQGHTVGPRADVYGLAASTYRALTGVPVSDAPNVPKLLYDAVHVMPRRPSTFVICDEDVDLVFALGLAKSPDDRFASGSEFAKALRTAARGKLDPELRERARQQLAVLDWHK